MASLLMFITSEEGRKAHSAANCALTICMSCHLYWHNLVINNKKNWQKVCI